MFVSRPLSYKGVNRLCSINVQPNPSLSTLRRARRYGRLWVDFKRGAYIRIQCQLPEKSAVFLQHRDALRARALIDFIDQEFAEKWAIGRCELCLFE
jgi:hypothetical protein